VIEILRRRREKNRQKTEHISRIRSCQSTDQNDTRIDVQTNNSSISSLSTLKSNYRTKDQSMSNDVSFDITADDFDYLRQLRSADVRGNPMTILAAFHRCHRSIDWTRKYLDEQRAQRDRQKTNRLQVTTNNKSIDRFIDPTIYF
jgi:hypothetical protein